MANDGAFGVAILEMDDEAEARRLGESDPSVRARLNRFELYPMQVSAARAKAPHPAIEGVAGNAAGEMGW